MYRPMMSAENARKLMRVDAVYGVSALLVASSGFARALWFGKGSQFYFENPLFWAKVGLFVLWAAVSLPPTFHFLSFRKSVRAGETVSVNPDMYTRIRRCLLIQLHLVPLVPILAVLMARGFGLPLQ